MSDLSKESIQLIYKYLESGLYENTIFSMITLDAWMRDLGVQAEINESYISVSFICCGNRRRFIAPLVKRKEDFEAAVIDNMKKHNVTFYVQVMDWQIPVLEKIGFDIKYHRDKSEYLYTPLDLIELKGKKFHQKRNFINGFAYEYEYREYNGSASDREGIEALMNLNADIRIESKERELQEELSEAENNLEAENKKKFEEDFKKIADEEIADIEKSSQREMIAVGRMLDDEKHMNCFVDVMLIDGRIVGFAAGEKLPSGIGTIYFEKGDTEYRGIYPVIDNLFVKTHFSGDDIKYVNKQEDMGLAGLKKSKESYRPVKMADVYTACLKEKDGGCEGHHESQRSVHVKESSNGLKVIKEI